MQIKNDIIWRLSVVYVGILIVAIFIIGTVIHLQFWENDKWNKKVNTLTFKDVEIQANRGDICAEDGRVLASSLPYYEIRMDFKSEAFTDKIFNDNVDSLAFCLASLFKDKTKSEYEKLLKKQRAKGNRSFLVKKDATYIELKAAKKFPIFRRGRYKGGVQYFQYNKRIHPYGNAGLRTIGRIKNRGEVRTQIGIEGAYDYELRGRNGVRLMQKLAESLWIPINDDNEIEPEDGKDIVTTLNADMQDFTQRALHKHLKKHNAKHGTVILMEVATGEIKAIANLERDDKSGKYRESYNFGIGTSTEPGSTFKLASIIAVLEDGYVKLDDYVDTKKGYIRYYKKFPIRDSKRGGHGKITIKKAFEVSSNVGLSKIIFDNYSDQPKKFVDRLYDMNLNDMTGIEIQGEGKPYIKYPGDKLWSPVSLPQMAIGYEVKLTALQTLTFYNAIANNGKMVKPKFVKEIKFHGITVKEIKTKVINNSICSQSTIEKVKSMLLGVVERGTATNLKNNKYKIAGKTGTAKIYDSKKGEYVNEYKASFAGYFPADNPKYSCIVMITKPQKNTGYYGGVVAAPLFKQISDKAYINMLNIHTAINDKSKAIATNDKIPYTKDGYKSELLTVFDKLNIPAINAENIKSPWTVTTTQEDNVKFDNRFVKEKIVPKVTGMGLRDALYILEKQGLNVSVKGRGTVVRQSIIAGTACKKGQKIVIELS